MWVYAGLAVCVLVRVCIKVNMILRLGSVKGNFRLSMSMNAA